MAPLLSAYGRYTGQDGALDPIDVVIRAPSALRKIPLVVLLTTRPDLPLQRLAPQHLKGAVLVYEYRFAGAPTGVFCTDDIFGDLTVLAPREARMEVAEEVCRFLVDRGGIACLISVDAELGDGSRHGHRPSKTAFDVGRRVRFKERDLVLRDNLEATLATLGRSTRHNLRRYRARVQEHLGARFVPNAVMSAEEMIELSRQSTNPVPDDVSVWRHKLAEAQPHGIFAGLQAADGRWLSVVGGRREGDRAILKWQTNRAGVAHISICSAMRSFLIEDEIGRGTRTISFLGGTHHSLAYSLQFAAATDVIAVRRGLRGEALRRLGSRLLPESNFLGHALDDPEMEWSGKQSVAA